MSRHVARLPRPHDAGRRGCFTGLVLPRRGPERFAMVPEQLLEADLPDTAVRLYGLLLRCPVVDGAHVQSRARLAERLHRSLDTVDRAVTALVEAGWIQVAHRFSEGQQICNAYVVLPAPVLDRRAIDASPGSMSAAAQKAVDDAPVIEGSCAPVDPRVADEDGGAVVGGSRTSAARGAALLRHGRESLTQSPSPSPPHHAHPTSGGAPSATQRPQRAAARGGLAFGANDVVRSYLVRELARKELVASGVPVTRATISQRACELLGARLDE